MTITVEEQKSNARKWVAALRSGEFKQGNSYLYNATNDSYCCLGLGCTVIGTVPSIQNGVGYFDHRAAVAPRPFMEAVGLSDESGLYGPFRTLAGDNDDRGLTFAQIADIIESCPDGLFVWGSW